MRMQKKKKKKTRITRDKLHLGSFDIGFFTDN